MAGDIGSGSDVVSGAFRRVAMFARSENRHLDVDLARRLGTLYNSKVYLYCQREEDKAYYERLSVGAFASIEVFDALLEADSGSEGSEDNLFRRARGWEERLNVTINELLVNNRHLGRGYSLGGLYHPRSRLSERTSYAQAVRVFVACLEYYEQEFTRKDVTLVMNGDRASALVAQSMGVAFREFALSRYRNFYYWGWNEFWETPEIEAAYHRPDLALGPDINAPITAYAAARPLFLRQMTLVGACRRTAYRLAQHAWWLYRGYQKARNYRLFSDIALYWRMWRDWRQVKRMSVTSLADLAGRPFVFVPLLTEPERALQGLSPEKFDQLSTIVELARDLPAGVLLAVKENILAIGRRPRDFYTQIAECKNIVLLDPLEQGQACVRAASAVALITGSIGFEAAVLGCPVIDLGCHNIYSFLPHVFRVHDAASAKQALRSAVFATAADRAVWREAGLRFIAAVAACSFDMRDYDFLKKSGYDPASGDEALQKLISSLAVGGAVGAPAAA